MGSSGVLVQSTIISLCTAKSDGRCQDYDEIKRFNIVDLNLELQGITKIRSLDAFTNLTRLRLNNNNVEIIEGLDRLGKLESIGLSALLKGNSLPDLSFNKIKRLEGLGSLLALKLLVISHNELSSIANSFTHLQYLEMLVLNSNKLRDVNEFDHLQKCASLRSLSLKSNPLCVNTNYQEHILAVIPNLIYLDGINRAKTRLEVENTHKGKNETVSNEDQCMAAVCENGEEKRARESRYKAAFVDEWNPEKFFANGFLNKFDHTICNLPGNIENFQEYQKQVLEVCKQITLTGMDSKRIRDSEISQFEQFIRELNKYFKMKSIGSIQQYYNVEKKLNFDNELDDIKNEKERFQMSRQPLEDLHDDLMKFETELENQLEENMDDFERMLLTLTDEFIQAIEAKVAICRKAEDEYYEKVSNHCFHLLDKVPLEEMGVEVTPQLCEMFEDKESLTEVLADCHAGHTSSFYSKVDNIRERCQSWLKEVLLGFRNTYIEGRRRARVFEIHHFMETQWDKLNSTKLSRSPSAK